MATKYNVFISSKSEDYKLAHQVYNFLEGEGLSVFFADTELKKIGNANYSSVIDTAIDNSEHMIVVCSKKEFVESKWVKSEWDTFSKEVKAGRKKGNLLTILNGMKVDDLPIALRNNQSFISSNYKDSILYYLRAIDEKKDVTKRNNKNTPSPKIIFASLMLSLLVTAVLCVKFTHESSIDKKMEQRKEVQKQNKIKQIESEIKLVAGQMDSAYNVAYRYSKLFEEDFPFSLEEMETGTLEYKNLEKTEYTITKYSFDLNSELIDYVNCMIVYNRDFEKLDSLELFKSQLKGDPINNVDLKNRAKTARSPLISYDDKIGYDESRERWLAAFCDFDYWLHAVSVFLITFVFCILGMHEFLKGRSENTPAIKAKSRLNK